MTRQAPSRGKILRSFNRFQRRRRQAPAKAPRLALETLECRCLLSAGGLDPTFAANGKLIVPAIRLADDYGQEVRDIAVQPDGKVIAVGAAEANGTSALVMARYTASGYLDTTFQGTGKVTLKPAPWDRADSARGVALQADGKIVVVGKTGYHNGEFLVLRFNTDGSPDKTFNTNGMVTTYITSSAGATSVAIQADGKIVVVGEAYNGSNEVFAAARYNPDGSLDTTFDGDGRLTTSFGSWATVRDVVLQSDGKIVVAGESDGDFALAQYNPDGSLDSTFAGDGKLTTDFATGYDYAYRVALQSDGKIVAAGAGGGGAAVARYNPDGSLDAAFDGDGKLTATFPSPGGWFYPTTGLAIQGDGKILVSGYSGTDFAVARYNSNGTLDTAFDGDGKVTTNFGAGSGQSTCLAVDSAGRIIAAGSWSPSGLAVHDATGNSGADRDFALARYTTSGSLDTGFNGSGKTTTGFAAGMDSATSLALQVDGKIVVAGSSYTGPTTSYGKDGFALARVNADGSMDGTFGSSGKTTTGFGTLSAVAQAVAIQSDGKVILAGYAKDMSTSDYDFALARYSSSGALDTTFGSGGKVMTSFAGSTYDLIYGIAVQADGKIIAAGRANGKFGLARYNTDGSLDSSFDGDGLLTTSFGAGYGEAHSVAIQSDGKIVVAGSWGSTMALARYDANGSPDPSFDGDGQLTASFGTSSMYIQSLALQADGKILVAGQYSASGTCFALARFQSDGSWDTSFDGDGQVTTLMPDMGGPTYAYANDVALQSDGKIVAVGYARVNNYSQEAFTLVRYHSDGSLDAGFDNDGIQTTTFGVGNDAASGVAIQSNGQIVVAGTVDTATGTRFAVARFDAADNPAAPTVSNLSPADNASGVAVTTNLMITFTKDIQKGSGNIVLKRADYGGSSVIATIAVGSAQVTVSGTQATIDPVVTLADLQSYYVEIDSGAFQDSSGNYYGGFADAVTWSFHTGDYTPPRVTSLSPADDSTGVGLNANLVLTFTENLQKGTGSIVLKNSSDDSVVETISVYNARVTVTGKQVTIDPSVTFAPGTGYYVQISSGAFQDYYGNAYAGIEDAVTWNFGTAGILSGVKFNDLDGDGTKDAGEPGLANWTIYLDADLDGQLDAGETSTATLADGSYSFGDLAWGTYTVAEVRQAGWVQTYPRGSVPSIERVSSDGGADRAAVSGDGRFVAFRSAAANLVPGDTNATYDVFVHDRQGDVVERVSVSADGTQGNAGSGGYYGPSISADGRYVAFESAASNLVPGDTNGAADIFVYDRRTDTIERVSLTSGGSQSNGTSEAPAISANGRYVAFYSFATNLIPGANGYTAIYVYDRQADTIEQVSRSSDGSQANYHCFFPALSADGRYVAFSTGADNLVPGDTNWMDVFVYDRQLDTIERVSLSSGGAEADASANQPAISADGRYVAFLSAATNLVPGDTNGYQDVFVYDRQLDTIERVSVAADGTQGNGDAGYDHSPSLSADGRYVSFDSSASNLVPGDSNASSDVFVYDRQTDRIQRVSIASDGTQGEYSSGRSHALSADGRYVAFDSSAGNLVPGDTSAQDVFATGNPLAWVSGSQVVSIGAGQVAAAVDFGNFECGSISGRVFRDSDGDGVLETGEPGLAGWTVYLDTDQDGRLDAGELSTTTPADGSYSFAGLGPGLQTVAVEQKFGWLQTAPAGGVHSLSLSSGQDVTDRDFGYFAGTISGRKFNDLDGDGVQEEGEPGLAGWTIYLDADLDGERDAGEVSTTTLTDGSYEFRGLDPGTHTVAEVPQFGWERTYPATGTPATERISLSNTSSEGNGYSSSPSTSADGRYVAFSSFASNLVPGDTNEAIDIFVLDRQTDTVERVSVASDGTQANSSSTRPSISADGRYVAFLSSATNLVSGDTNGRQDVFVYDRDTDTIKRVHCASDGSQAWGGSASENVSLSADGRYVAFASYATNLVADDTNGKADIFVFDRQTDTIERVSLANDGTQGNNHSVATDAGPSISADGRYVAFESSASNLVPGDTNAKLDVFVYDRQTDTIERVSVASAGTQGNGVSRSPAISADGRSVVFYSEATDLVPGDTNGYSDVFVYDRQTDTVERVSLASDGTQGNYESGYYSRSISADGRFVAFDSYCSNLVPPTGVGRQVYVYDRQTDQIARVSMASDGSPPNGNVETSAISADGRYVAFDSYATNLVSGDTNGQRDMFAAGNPWAWVPGTHVVSLRAGQDVTGIDFGNKRTELRGSKWNDLDGDGVWDQPGEPGLAGWTVFLDDDNDGQLDAGETSTVTQADGSYHFLGVAAGRRMVAEVPQAGWTQTAPASGVPATERVSLASDGTQANGYSGAPAVSPNGRYVAFSSTATNLVSGDSNGKYDIFVYDRQDDTIERVSVGAGGAQANGNSYGAKISDDGRYVAFHSEATNLISGDTNGYTDLFVYDRQADTVQRVSVAQYNTQVYGHSYYPSLSADGRYVAFSSDATSLVSGDTNGIRDVFVYDRQAATIERVSVAADGSQGNGTSESAVLSADGRYVAYASMAGNLVPGDTNGCQDIFVYDRQSDAIERVSLAADGSQTDGSSYEPQLSSDGRRVTFSSYAANLVSGDTNGSLDVFVYDRLTDAIERVSVSTGGVQGDGESTGPTISADGRYVAFYSDARNLVPGDTNWLVDVFVRDRQTGRTDRVHISWTGVQGNSDAYLAAISGDGLYVAFQSYASNLVPGDTNNAADIFVRGNPLAWVPGSHVVALAGGQSVMGLDFGNQQLFDFGDAPDPTYPTLLASNGARHALGGPVLGPTRDMELNGQPHPQATGDDLSGASNDEDGVVWTGLLVRGLTATVNVDMTASPADGLLDAWLDFNRDGDWADAGEQIFTSQAVLKGAIRSLSVAVPSGAATGTTYARFRVSTAGGLSLDGPAADGEVEDMLVEIVDPGEIRGSKWHDLNEDAIWDQPDEPGLASWTVFLDADGDGQRDGDETWTTTGVDGSYAFTNLRPGTYTIAEGAQTGWQQTAPALSPPIIGRASVAADGSQANSSSSNAFLSADGRYVAFESYASNLVPNDTNERVDIFLRDRQTGTVERVSLASDGTQADGNSSSPAVSADGRYVTFHSYAANLVPGDSNGSSDVFVFDRQTRLIERVSLASDGTPGNGNSSAASISADGRYVAFNSYATNLVPGDSNSEGDVFVYDRSLDTIRRVSLAWDGSQANGLSTDAALSADGRYVSFRSFASNLVPGDTNGSWDIFVCQLQTDLVERVSLASDGTQGNGWAYAPSLSADGRYVAFYAAANNLVPGDTNGCADVFVYDRQTNRIERVSLAADGTPGNQESSYPSITADGRYVTFQSYATNLVPGDTNGRPDVFVFDRQTDRIERLSQASDATQGNNNSYSPALSADGRHVVFDSSANNLVSGDTNSATDVFATGNPLAWVPGTHSVVVAAGQVVSGLDFGNRQLQAPTDVTLNPAHFAEDIVPGSLVGTLATTDPTPGDSFTYALVSGAGDTDNASFTVAGDQLRTAVGAAFDHEADSVLSIRVRSTDSTNESYEKTLLITVDDVPEVLTVDPDEVQQSTGAVTVSIGADGLLHAYQTGTTTDAVPPHNPGMVTAVLISGRDGEDDVFTVDLSQGNPVSAGGITFAGGASGHDVLDIQGGSAGHVTYQSTSGSGGSVVLAGIGTFSYSGLEAIANSLSASDVTFDLSASDDQGLLTAAGGHLQLQSAGGSFAQTTFTAPGGALPAVTIRGGNGADAFTLDDLSAVYAGPVVVDGGGGQDTVIVLSGGVLTGCAEHSAAVDLQGGVLNLADDAEFDALAGTAGGSVALGDHRLTVGASQATTAFDGTLDGSGGLTKTGDGTLTLGGINTYTGTTEVLGGRLLVEGELADGPADPDVIVYDLSALGGAGRILGTIEVRPGGTLAPGASPEVLITGDVLFAAGATFQVELDGPTPGPNPGGYDQLLVQGSVTLSEISPGVTLDISLGYVPLSSDRFVVVANDGTDPVVGTFRDSQGNPLAEGAMFTVSGRQFRITYAGGDGNNDVVLANDDTGTLIVTQFVPTSTGFRARFGRDVDPSVLNLYDGASQTLGAADVAVTGAIAGAIRGSLVVSADRRQITFVQTGGILEPDTYMVTLFSGDTRFRQPTGGTLDGNADGTPGDYYQTTFTVSARPAGTATICLPDFARGPAQPVNISHAATGLPIQIDGAAAVTSLAVDVVYDPALLEITAATLAAGLPGDWSVDPPDTSTPGVAKIRASGTTPLSGTDLDVVRLTAAVPTGAPYGAIQAIRLENVSLNGGAIAAIGDVAVHKAVYLGDADGSGIHSSADAFLTVQAALGLASGFAAHAWTDPRIVGDADGSGVLSAADAFLIVQEGLGLAEPFVPDNPHVTITPVGGGVDPQFQIDVLLPAAAGGQISVPVNLEIEPAATNVGGFDFDLYFDPSLLTIEAPDGVSPGADTTGSWVVAGNLMAAGHLRVVILNTSGVPLAPGVREVAQLLFSVDAGAAIGVAPLDIEPSDPAAGGYTWTAADGSLWIGAALDWHNEADPLDVDGNGLIEALDALIMINYINAHPNEPALPAPGSIPHQYYDVTDDGDCTALDVVIVINHLNAEPPLAAEGESIGPVSAFTAASRLVGGVFEGPGTVFDDPELEPLPLDAVLRDLADDIASAWRSSPAVYPLHG